MVARGALPAPVPEPEQLAGTCDDGRRAHVVAGAAILDRVDAARVVRHHAADRRHVGAAAGGRGEEEAVRPELAVERRVDDARFDVDLEVLGPDGDHARHARAVEDDAAVDGNRVALQARAGTACGERDDALGRQPHHRDDVVGRERPDDRVRPARGQRGGVVGCGGEVGGAARDAVRKELLERGKHRIEPGRHADRLRCRQRPSCRRRSRSSSSSSRLRRPSRRRYPKRPSHTTA